MGIQKFSTIAASLTLLVVGSGCGKSVDSSFASRLASTSEPIYTTPGGGGGGGGGGGDDTSNPGGGPDTGSDGSITCKVYDLSVVFKNMGCDITLNTNDLTQNLAASNAKATNYNALRDCGMKLPDFGSLTPVATLKLKNFDVSERDWKLGFPGLAGNAAALREWYGLSCTGKIKVTGEQTLRTYQLFSDDGSKFYIDGRLVVDNDGMHAPLLKSGSINLASGSYKFRLDWYQGPRVKIALRLGQLTQNGSEILPEETFEPDSPPTDACPVIDPVGV